MGFNVGGFTGGLAGGLTLGSGLRKARQEEKLRDVITRRAKMGEKTDAKALFDQIGMGWDDTNIGDPFGARLFNMAKSGFTNAVDRMRGVSAVDPLDDPDAAMVDPLDDPAGGFANGGRVRRYALGGSVMARGPQMTGNPNPRLSAPMGGGMPARPMQPQPQPMPPQRPAALPRQPIALGAPGMGGFGQGGGKPQLPPQPMPRPMQPPAFGGGGGMPMRPMQPTALPRQQQPMHFDEGGEVPETEAQRRARLKEEAQSRRGDYRDMSDRERRTKGLETDAERSSRTTKKPSALERARRGTKYKSSNLKDAFANKPGARGLARLRGPVRGGAVLGGIYGGTKAGLQAAFGDSPETSDYLENWGMGGEAAKEYAAGLSPLQDFGYQTAGVLSGIGDMFVPEFLKKYTHAGLHEPVELSDSVKRDMAGMQEEQPAEAPLEEDTDGGATEFDADRPPAPPDAHLRPQAGQQQQGPGMQQMNFSGRNPAEVPNFTTDEWVKHRRNSMAQMIARGIPVTEAMEKVDQQITGMQQRNFANYAMQGIALMQAGDMNGAQAALYAAFQYFPSGSDVKFGTHNGQLFGVGIDEKTGQPVGQPFPVTPDSIAAVVDNFRKEGAWNEWTKDRREFQQKMRQYEEVDRPLAEAQGSAWLTNADANVLDANARNQAASGGGSAGLTDLRATRNYFTEQYMNVEGLDVSPELARNLASASMQIWEMQGRRIDPTQIIEAVSRAVRIKDPQQRQAFFSRMGVSDPIANMGSGGGP